MPIPFGFVHRTVWPVGKDGPLVVFGITTSLPTGTVKDYNNITVKSSGTLNISGTNGAWAILGSSGVLVVDSDSQIVNQSLDDSGGSNPPAITATTPDGYDLSYSITVSLEGGYGGGGQSGQPGGNPDVGNGGGGGAANNSGEDATSQGGRGGDGTQGAGGAGGVGYSANGQDGGNASAEGTDVSAGGGGGGVKGINGGGISLTVAGPLFVSGLINCSGQQGGSGGNGGNADGDSLGEYYISAGGGGGGGDAGAGGSCNLRWRGLGLDPSGNIVADGGDTGGGGFGGESTDGGSPTGGGDNGDDGQSANPGTVVITTLTF